MTLVEEVMVKDVVTAKESETIYNAVIKMIEHDVGCLVVVRDDKPIGILTEKDVLTRVIGERRDPLKTKVGKIMTAPCVTTHPLVTIEEAATMMNEKDVQRLVIVSSNTDTLAGILGTKDLVVAESKMIEILRTYLGILEKGCL